MERICTRSQIGIAVFTALDDFHIFSLARCFKVLPQGQAVVFFCDFQVVPDTGHSEWRLLSKLLTLAADSVTCKLQPGSPEIPHCRMLKPWGLFFPLGGIFLFLSLVFKSFLSVLLCFITWQEYFQMSLNTL